MELLINIDVPDLEKAESFYCAAFGLTVGRRFGASGVELLNGSSPIYLLAKTEGSRAVGSSDKSPSDGSSSHGSPSDESPSDGSPSDGSPSDGSPSDGSPSDVRRYVRHWTPVHLDFVVADIEHAVRAAVAAGARLEQPSATHAWGKLALLADPFGNGFCFVEFVGRGYDEIAQ